VSERPSLFLFFRLPRHFLFLFLSCVCVFVAFLFSQTHHPAQENTSSIPFCLARNHHVCFHACQKTANPSSVCLICRLSGCLYLCITRSQIPKRMAWWSPTDHDTIPILRSARHCPIKKETRPRQCLASGWISPRDKDVPTSSKGINAIPPSYQHCISIDHPPEASDSLTAPETLLEML
jgi:hypothetical protein